MNLPMYLQPGRVAIYGAGTASGITSLQPDNAKFLFGRIQQVWNYGNINASIGDWVMFNNDDVICRLILEQWPYTIIEQAKLVITEIQAIPLP